MALPGLWAPQGTGSFSTCLNLCLCTFTQVSFAKLCAENTLHSREGEEAPALCFARLPVAASDLFLL